MKDLCDLNIVEQGVGQDVQSARLALEVSPVTRSTKIKSFHRRNRDVVATAEAHSVQARVEPTQAVVSDDTGTIAPKSYPEPQTPLWSRLNSVSINTDHAIGNGLPLVDRFRDTESAKAIDLLRTRLLHTLRAQGWRRVAIASPTGGCGATWTTVNLAQGLARVPNSRSIVMDMNFRNPGVAKALALSVEGDMAGFLSGRLPAHRHLLRLNDGLAVGLNGTGQATGSEVLQNPTAGKAIDAMMEDSRADVALFDLPPVLEHDDLTAFLPQVDGVLIVADGTRTTAKDLAACEKILAGHTQLLGVVLNRARPE